MNKSKCFKWTLSALLLILCLCILKLATKGEPKEIVFERNSQLNLLDVENISFPLSTKGTRIVDSRGNRVKLVGVNWSGAHMIRHCVDGL